jgi:hypothetical protein
MKLKYRITGTILAIALATTSALPAATIPQLKNPPKAVAKVPSAPAAPRIPVAPRIVNVPKVPAVKVPVVKVPVSPRIVSAPKIPVVKAAPKIPAAPRIVSSPKVPVVKTPVKVAAATRIPAVKTPATISPKAPVAVSRPVNSPKLNPKDIRKVINEALKPTLITRTPDFATLPTRSLPGSKKPNLKPTSPGTPSLDGTPGTATPTIGTHTIPALGDGRTTKPAFDNGFGPRPQLSEADLGNALNLNPMNGVKGGPASSGPLGDSDIGGSPSNGVAEQGQGLISDGGSKPEGNKAKDQKPANSTKPTVTDSYTDQDGNKHTKYSDGTHTWVSPDGTTTTLETDGTFTTINPKSQTRTVTDAGEMVSTTMQVNSDGSATISHIGETTGEFNLDTGAGHFRSGDERNVVYYDGDGTRHVYVDGQKVGVIRKDGSITPSQPAGQPDPENRNRGNRTFGAAVGQQIKQGNSGRKGSVGGGADVMPVNESHTGGAARIPGAAVPQNKNGMVGNPGQQGGPENGGVTPPTNSNDQGNVTNPNPTDN